jgi:hypothetical protein
VTSADKQGNAEGRRFATPRDRHDISVMRGDVSKHADIVDAHKRCSAHRTAVLAAKLCGCFYCCTIFEPGEITDWVDPLSDDMQAGTTALCPRCGIDSVIPMEGSMDVDFLRRMKEHWF